MARRWLRQSRTHGSDSRIDLTHISLESLPAVSISIGVLFLVLAVGHLLVLPRATAVRMSIAGAGAALVLFAVAVAVKRSAIPPRWAHATGAGVAGLLVAINLLRLALTGEFEQTTYFFLLVIVGVGSFLLSTPWFALVIAGTLAGWGAVVWTDRASFIGPPSARIQFGLVMLGGILLSALIHRQRIRTLRRLERVRIRDQEREKELNPALQAARESEARYRDLLDNMNDLVQSAAVDGTILYVNQAWQETLGYPEEEMEGFSVFDVIHPDEHAHCRAILQQLTEETCSQRVQTTFVTTEGEQIIVEGSLNCRFEDGVPVATRGVFRDITERVRAERELQRRNQDLAARNAVARALAASLDLDDLFNQALSSTVDALGFSAGVITLADEETGALKTATQIGLPAALIESYEDSGLERTLWSVVYREGEPLSIGDLRTEEGAGADRLLRSGLQACVGTPIVRKDRVLGTLCLFHHKPRTFSEADSELLSSLGQQIGMAVENARLFEQSRRRRLYLNAVLSAAPDAIITVDADNRIVEWNAGAERVFGYSRDEVIGKDLDPTITESQVIEEARDFTRMTMEGEKVLPTEAVRYRKDGSPVQVILAGSPILIDGDVVGAVAVYTDISDLKQAQEELRQHAEDLEARNEELDAFAHTVAHDLKNPLQHLIGYAEVLHADYDVLSDETREDALETIARAADRMDNIVEELLLLAAVRRGEVRTEPLDMAPIVAEAQDRLAYVIEERSARISVPETWPAAMGHAAWVEEAWANYLSNAIKYGGDPPRVELGASEQPDGMVRFWVRDNGQGLTPEDQARLFIPFTRLHQVRAEGQGLGLSIVRRILDKLEGQVGVESEVGEGSTFYFTLPQA